MLQCRNQVDKYPDTFWGDSPHSEWTRQLDDKTTPGDRSPMDGQVNIAEQNRVRVPCPSRSARAAVSQNHQVSQVQDECPCGRL